MISYVSQELLRKKWAANIKRPPAEHREVFLGPPHTRPGYVLFLGHIRVLSIHPMSPTNPGAVPSVEQLRTGQHACVRGQTGSAGQTEEGHLGLRSGSRLRAFVPHSLIPGLGLRSGSRLRTFVPHSRIHPSLAHSRAASHTAAACIEDGLIHLDVLQTHTCCEQSLQSD